MNYPKRSDSSSSSEFEIPNVDGMLSRVLEGVDSMFKSSSTNVTTTPTDSSLKRSGSGKLRPSTPERGASQKSLSSQPAAPNTIKDECGSYEGQIRENLRHGQGKQLYANGDVYEGQWENNKRHGQGEYTFKSTGLRYNGQFSNDKRTGKATCTFPDGSIYEGDFVDGQMQGNGSHRMKDGTVFDGAWSKGQKHGKGVCTNRGGDRLEGEWKNNVLDHGKITYADGSTYNGDLKNYVKHGQGTYRWKSGVEYTGEWIDNQRQKKGTLRFPDGTTYEGEFLNGQSNGKGKAKYADGTTYEGDYVRGIRHGQGTARWKGGEVYTGEWVNGEIKAQPSQPAPAPAPAPAPTTTAAPATPTAPVTPSTRDVSVRVINASNLPKGDFMGKNDTFIQVTVGSVTLKTSTKDDSGDNATWNEVLVFKGVPLSVNTLKVEAFDEDSITKADLLGAASVRLAAGAQSVALSNGGTTKGTVNISIDMS